MSGFRRREREAVEELTRHARIVLATGGGAVLDGDTRRDLANRGWVVYLEASIAQQAERAGRTHHRPLLQGTDPLVRLEELLRVREPLYRSIADSAVSGPIIAGCNRWPSGSWRNTGTRWRRMAQAPGNRSSGAAPSRILMSSASGQSAHCCALRGLRANA